MALSRTFIAKPTTPNERSRARLANVYPKTMVAAETYANDHPKVSRWCSRRGSSLVNLVANYIPACRVKIRPLDAKLWHLEIIVQNVTEHI